MLETNNYSQVKSNCQWEYDEKEFLRLGRTCRVNSLNISNRCKHTTEKRSAALFDFVLLQRSRGGIAKPRCICRQLTLHQPPIGHACRNCAQSTHIAAPNQCHILVFGLAHALHVLVRVGVGVFVEHFPYNRQRRRYWI